jgi:hypothetical protein
MDMKNTLSQLIKDRTSRRHKLRSLKKNDPLLWAAILEKTSFLDESASAPQRVWHIMNDIYEVQVCEVTGEQVSWINYEKGYCKHKDHKTSSSVVGQKVRTTVAEQGHWRKNKEKADDANEHYQIGMILGLHVPFVERDRDHAAAAAKAKQTCLARYGVDNYRKTAEMKDRQRAVMDERYREVRDSWDERQKYYAEVAYYTEKSWNENFYYLTENRKIERGPDFHLDHIYSRAQGFKEGISAEIIGHWTNLRLISRQENSAKRDRCDKTKEQLLEDFSLSYEIIQQPG